MSEPRPTRAAPVPSVSNRLIGREAGAAQKNATHSLLPRTTAATAVPPALSDAVSAGDVNGGGLGTDAVRRAT